MTRVAPLLARLASAPLAICPRRGAAALRSLNWNWEPGEEIPLPEDPAPGVIPIHGVLVHRGLGYGPEIDAMCGIAAYDSLIAAVRQAAADPKVAAIVLDVDSPGGEIAGLPDAADAIRAARDSKPVVAIANDCACSAAFVLAAAAEKVHATRTAYVGSVGVVSMHEDLSGLLAQQGVRVEFVYAGEKKIDGNAAQPLSPRARADIQSEVDEAYRLITESVAASRGMGVAAVRATEAGVYRGQGGVEIGFVDQLGTLEGALAAAREMAAKNKAPGARMRFGSRPQFSRRSA